MRFVRKILRKIGLIPAPLPVANIQAVAVLSAEKSPDGKKEDAVFNITDRTIINQILSEIDFRTEKDGRGLAAVYDAYIFFKEKNGAIKRYVALAEYEYLSTPEDLSVMFPISKEGESVLRDSTQS